MRQAIKDVAEALAAIDNVTLAMPALSVQLDDVIAKLERVHELANPVLGQLGDIFDRAALIAQMIDRVKKVA